MGKKNICKKKRIGKSRKGEEEGVKMELVSDFIRTVGI